MNHTDIRIIQQDYIRALQELGRLHNELNAAGEGAWDEVLDITQQLAEQEPPNWTAMEIVAGQEALLTEDDDDGDELEKMWRRS